MSHYSKITAALEQIGKHLDDWQADNQFDTDIVETVLHQREVWQQTAECLAGVLSDLAGDGRPPQEILDSWRKVAEARIAAQDLTL